MEPPKNDRIVMKGSPLPQYPIPNKLAEHVVEAARRAAPPLRGVGDGHNAFASRASSTRSRSEPARIRWRSGSSYRKAQPRMQTSAAHGRRDVGLDRKRDGRALGIAFMEKDDTLAAGVAEVSVDRATGKIKVHNVWAAIDAGIAVQPSNVAAQTEGSIVWASATCCVRRSPSRTAACSSRTSPTTR